VKLHVRFPADLAALGRQFGMPGTWRKNGEMLKPVNGG
jgi:hypothetical protein